MARRILVLGVAALVFACAEQAQASEIIARDAVKVSIKVDSKSRAVVYYTRAGKRQHPLLWGATNARPPSQTTPQVKFRRDYSGGWKAFGKPIWKTIRDVCKPYDGPALGWFVTGCKTPNGGYWALQAFQRQLPNLGVDPWKASQSVWELHLSHWKGELPKLELYSDWVIGKRFHHLFGRFTYMGLPVYGFEATSAGVPLDSYGRNLYLDTLNSAYGAGWKRENSFLTHRPNGNFCYGFYEHDPPPGYPDVGRRPKGNGERYRLTVMGPGVTPVIVELRDGLPDYDKQNPEHVAHEQAMNDLGDELAEGDLSRTRCSQH